MVQKHNGCVRNPPLASRNVWCLEKQDPGSPVRGPWPMLAESLSQKRRAPRAGAGQASARRRGHGSGHGKRTARMGLESRGWSWAWRSRPPYQIEPWVPGPRGRPCPPSLARTRWAGWRQLIPGLGGGRGGSFARVHLGGLWAWAATHSGPACSPHILLFRRLYPLGCECLCPGARG